VRGGRSAVVVVRGEAGIGKTELLRALVAEAAGFRVCRATGIESEMELAYAGLHQLCTPLLDRLGSLAEPQRRGLSVAFGLESLDGDAPDRFLVALAALSSGSKITTNLPGVPPLPSWALLAALVVLGAVVWGGYALVNSPASDDNQGERRGWRALLDSRIVGTVVAALFLAAAWVSINTPGGTPDIREIPGEVSGAIQSAVARPEPGYPRIRIKKVGIDLGTTNSALAYIDPEEASEADYPPVHTLMVDQQVAADRSEALRTLPSFIYLSDPPVVGAWARE